MKTRAFSILFVVLITVCLTVGTASANETTIPELLEHRSALPAPTLTCTTSGTTVSLSWTSIIDATGYYLNYAPYPYTGPETIGTIDMEGQTEISVDLWEGAAFYVAVQAYNSVGSSSYSNIERPEINEPPSSSRYFPQHYNKGDRWKTQMISSGGNRFAEYGWIGAFAFNGVLVDKIYWSNTGFSGAFAIGRFEIVDNEYRVTEMEFPGSGCVDTYSPYFALPFDIETRKTVSYSYRYRRSCPNGTGTPKTLTITYRFKGYENVKTSFGRFENCLKVEDDYNTNWYAQDIGLVKSISRDGDTVERFTTYY